MTGITLLIEQYKLNHEIPSYVETICDFAAEMGMEIDEIVDNIDDNLKNRIKTEFIKNNYFPNNKVEKTLEDFF